MEEKELQKEKGEKEGNKKRNKGRKRGRKIRYLYERFPGVIMFFKRLSAREVHKGSWACKATCPLALISLISSSAWAPPSSPRADPRTDRSCFLAFAHADPSQCLPELWPLDLHFSAWLALSPLVPIRHWTFSPWHFSHLFSCLPYISVCACHF